MMGKYLIKVGPYVLGVLVYLGVGEYLLYRTGELQPLQSIVAEQLQSNKDSHFGKALIPGNHLYLLEHLYQREADIIVLGQSITHQFQSRMFHPKEASFFNASNIFQTLDDLDFVISEIENGKIHKPELIIWGLDPDYLKYQKNQVPYFINGAEDPAVKIDQHLRGAQIIIKSVLRGTMDYVDLPGNQGGYGLRGIKGMGRRKDGSFDNRGIHEEYNKEPFYKERNDFKARLTDRRNPFEAPLELDQGLMNQFNDLISRVDKMDIEILFYCQQFSSDFMQYAAMDQEFADFWNDFTAICDSLDNSGHPMIPYGTSEDIGLDDRYMRDANHAGEVMTAIQLLNLLEKKGATVGPLRDIDLDHLRSLIDHRKSEMEL